MGSGTVLKRAIKKYGENNFIKEILFEANTAQEMFDKEKELVVIGSESYNLHPGGFGGFAFVNENKLNNTGDRSRIGERIRTARSLWSVEDTERHKKLSANTLRNAHKRGLIKYDTFTGKQHTLEAKKKISEGNRGNIPWNKGKNQTLETKEKIRSTMKGRTLTPEHRKAVSEAMKRHFRNKLHHDVPVAE
jgi:hypothetical protein